MKQDELIALFERMLCEKWAYVYGGASAGSVDCSGAFVWALKQGGKTIPHGSNAIARRETDALRPIAEAKPGYAAFKRRLPGEKGYALPAKYRSGSDQNDYYHIGLVAADGRTVLNAKSQKAGFCRDPLADWHCCAPLKAVEYGTDSTLDAISRELDALAQRLRTYTEAQA